MNIEHGEKQSSVRNKEMASKSPDFEALRAERNRVVMESHKRLADELGINLADIRSNYNPAACYCACSSGGPCEHKWDGDGV